MSITGILLVDKAKGPTSHDVVQAARDITGQRRCGHTGTLDPFATGLLPLCLGRATRIARFISGMSKTYSAVVRFGYATDTYDGTGRPTTAVVEPRLTRAILEPVLASFVGKQEQVPPPFAAKKIKGQRMYQLARAGVRVEARPVTVVIHRIRLLETNDNSARIDAEVESGTYIRSLAHDLGARLGCGAHLEELRRTKVGPFGVEQALTLQEVEELARTERLADAIWEPARALSALPAIRLGAQGAIRVSHGRPVFPDDVEGQIPDVPPGEACRLLGPAGELLGVGIGVHRGESARFRPVVVLAAPSRTD